MRLALFQPDIPQNLGTAVRLCACFAVALDVIEPCGFPMSHKGLRRAAMDYGRHAVTVLHPGWKAFLAAPERAQGRLVLFTTRGAQPHVGYRFAPGDTLLFGRESAGAPDEVHAAAQARVVIPIAAQTRSLNLTVSAAIGLAEALRQTGGLPNGALTDGAAL